MNHSPLHVPCLFLATFLYLNAPLHAADPVDSAADNNTNKAAEATTEKETFVANDQWRPVSWKPVSVAKGSALDFSGYLDAPAGKHGEIVCRDGRFSFQDAPGIPVRLYGTVMGHGLPYMTKEQCERYADFLAASGYNLVRFHNYLFVPDTMKEIGSTDFNPERQDQLDYLFACLKKRGIYYTFPLGSWGFFKAGDVTDLPEFSKRPFRFEFHGMLPISADAMRWLQTFSGKFLTHKNPYTGLALKDDPALISIELTNEDPLFNVLRHFPDLLPIYRRKCREALQASLNHEPTEQQVEQYLPRFVLERQEAIYSEMKTFLRKMGVTKPLTDITCQSHMAYAIPRSKQDYVDVHGYWDLYKRLPNQSAEQPAYRLLWSNPNTVAWGITPSAAAARIFGKPYMNGEFNSNYPTPYWYFTAPAEAALASGQEWSAIVRCGQVPYPNQAFTPTPVVRIEVGGNPLLFLSERIGSLLYAQNEMKALPVKLPIVVTPEYLRANVALLGGPGFPPAYYSKAFDCQIGTVLYTGTEDLSAYPALVTPPGMPIPKELKDKKWFAADGALKEKIAALTAAQPAPTRLQLDAASGSGKIITPRSETFLLPANQASAAGSCLSVGGNTTVSVCFASSLDPLPLDQSKHILVLYLTDLKNSGTEIEHEKSGSVIVRKYGKLPLLVRQGRVDFTFKMPGRLAPKIWALKYDGRRSQEIPVRATPDGFTFTAQAVSDPETFGSFELSWQ